MARVSRTRRTMAALLVAAGAATGFTALTQSTAQAHISSVWCGPYYKPSGQGDKFGDVAYFRHGYVAGTRNRWAGYRLYQIDYFVPFVWTTPKWRLKPAGTSVNGYATRTTRVCDYRFAIRSPNVFYRTDVFNAS